MNEEVSQVSELVGGEKEASSTVDVSDEQWRETIIADATNLTTRCISEAGIEISEVTVEEVKLSKKRKVEGLCDVCQGTTAKYCCPRCDIKSCSLICCRKHKTDNNCNGERNKTGYIPITEFKDSDLVSDLHFLEDGLRTKELAHKLLPKTRKTTKRLSILSQHMGERKIRFSILPSGMTKHERNSSFYDIKQSQIFWHVEWKFPSVNVTLKNNRLSETTTLLAAVTAHVAESKEKIEAYAAIGAEGLTIAMKLENTPANSIRHIEFDPAITIREALEGKDIIEFPTFLVLTPEESKHYRLVPNDIKQTDLFQLT